MTMNPNTLLSGRGRNAALGNIFFSLALVSFVLFALISPSADAFELLNHRPIASQSLPDQGRPNVDTSSQSKHQENSMVNSNPHLNASLTLDEPYTNQLLRIGMNLT